MIHLKQQCPSQAPPSSQSYLISPHLVPVYLLYRPLSSMDALPDEILLQVLCYLDLQTITHFQQVCQRFLTLARDSGFWKLRCYDESRFEANRKRQLLLSSQDPNLVALRTAITASSVPYFWLWPETTEQEMARDEGVRRRASQVLNSPQHGDRQRALASWDPAYPAEKVDFYQEYVQRHAPVHVDWLSPSKEEPGQEIIGVGAISYSTLTKKFITAQEDGSIQVWDVASHGGRMIDQTKPGVLSTSSSNKDRETGAIENISIDDRTEKAYIAISDQLHELDLNTLQVSRRQAFPFPITVLSEARHPVPITVGTNQTLHLFDPRIHYTQPSNDTSTRLELIGGTPPKDTFPPSSTSTARINLEQPGPTSILHLSHSYSDDDLNGNIWVSGRFTSLLNYDRRVWPRIAGTLFSGARLSCLTSLPHPYVPRGLNLSEHANLSFADLDAVKAAQGATIIAAGEYKGKGSLELYGLPRSLASHASSPTFAVGLANEYRNRQTASATRLISVATHGTTIVFSDGDGHLKWVERDGSTLVREESINVPLSGSRRSSATSNAPLNTNVTDDSSQTTDDIVQKLLPIRLTNSSTTQPDDLLLYTGEGRVGIMGFGRKPLSAGFPDPGDGEADEVKETLEEAAEREERRAKEEEERKFGRMMRKALERQADEVRFVRGLGNGV